MEIHCRLRIARILSEEIGKGYWDCHIEPDWLLIYKLTQYEVRLARTGTHADLFAR